MLGAFQADNAALGHDVLPEDSVTPFSLLVVEVQERSTHLEYSIQLSCLVSFLRGALRAPMLVALGITLDVWTNQE